MTDHENVILVPESLRPDDADSRYRTYTDAPEGDVASIRFYVPPYMGGVEGFMVMASMPRLEVCQLPTAGFDHALPYLPDRVALCNAGGVHDASTAELAVGLLLSRLRRLDDMARAMPGGEWIAGRYDALADRRVLILGFGGVGQAIAARLSNFEVDVIPMARTARDGVHGMAELPTILPTVDVVILAVPLNDQTRGLVDQQFLSSMRDGAVLVNVARGPVVDTGALVSEVASGRIRAALDVTDPEPLPPGHPLWRMPGVLISPHAGGNTTAFEPRMRRLIAAQVGLWTAGRRVEHVVVA